jgi:hypothetical protein
VTDEQPITRKRRPKHEVVADLERRLARHKHAGAREALDLVREASKLLENAHVEAGGTLDGPEWKAAQDALGKIDTLIDTSIPKEAR